MATPAWSQRPLPVPPAGASSPKGPRPNHSPEPMREDLYSLNSPYYMPGAYSSYAPYAPDLYEETQTTSVPVGTFLHKGFYDLLAMIPTPSPSRLLWKAPAHLPEASIVAGPRYEDQGYTGTKAMPKKGRRVSKDMVSKPTGFVYVL